MTRQSSRTKAKAPAPATAAATQTAAAGKKGHTATKGASGTQAREVPTAGESDEPPKTAKRSRQYTTTVEETEDEDGRPPVKRKEKPIVISEDGDGDDDEVDDEDEEAELGEALSTLLVYTRQLLTCPQHAYVSIGRLRSMHSLRRRLRSRRSKINVPMSSAAHALRAPMSYADTSTSAIAQLGTCVSMHYRVGGKRRSHAQWIPLMTPRPGRLSLIAW